VNITVFDAEKHRSEEYEGVFVGVQLDVEKRNIAEVTFRKCIRLLEKETRDAVVEMKDKLVCPWKDIIRLDIAHNHLFGSLQARSVNGRDVMLTDSGISSGRKGKERELKRWEGGKGEQEEEGDDLMDTALDEYPFSITTLFLSWS
jgi:hypothetical protein